ncbi:hypothetical protein H0H81_006234 [Sphagnurus paluster]|uniref:Uncharacterized protein n=1 Tax=Sphagnurus paluster TaxID=117069 RepID=A0A9P7GQ91_9AGAR|nr:hypothetical protein H0H81_006234 [Sphagnurus paluster]
MKKHRTPAKFFRNLFSLKRFRKGPESDLKDVKPASSEVQVQIESATDSEEISVSELVGLRFLEGGDGRPSTSPTPSVRGKQREGEERLSLYSSDEMDDTSVVLPVLELESLQVKPTNFAASVSAGLDALADQPYAGMEEEPPSPCGNVSPEQELGTADETNHPIVSGPIHTCNTEMDHWVRMAIGNPPPVPPPPVPSPPPVTAD